MKAYWFKLGFKRCELGYKHSPGKTGGLVNQTLSKEFTTPHQAASEPFVAVGRRAGTPKTVDRP